MFPPKTEKTRYQDLELNFIQSQMLRHFQPSFRYKCTHKINNWWKSITPLEPSNRTTVNSEKCNIAETHESDVKITFMNMTEIYKEKVNKPLNAVYENTDSGRKEIKQF